MKLTKTATKIKPGMTLIEITVVILVLLTLISVLFIGANIYKKGADRAACILNLRNLQQAARADQNLKASSPGGLLPLLSSAGVDGNGDPIPAVYTDFETVLIGAGKYFETAPKCPDDSDVYLLSGTEYPAIGTLVVQCPNIADLPEHIPADFSGW